MDVDECEANFEESKPIIAMTLRKDPHFLNRTFDNINIQPVYDIVLEDILHKTTPGAFIVGQHYIDELLLRIEDEFS